MARYYIASSPDVDAETIRIAMLAPYDRMITAYSDMGGGVVFDENGDLRAYHERHADSVDATGTARMANWQGQ